MAVYKRTFKAYRGPLTPMWSRFMVLTRFSFATLFDSKPLTAYAVLCQMPLLLGMAFIYFAHNSAAQAILGLRGQPPKIDHEWFSIFLFVESWLAFIFTAWTAPGLISKDFANSAVQLYLSRPLSRPQYLLGKVGVLAVCLSAITWVPTLIVFFLQAGLEGNGWLGENYWMIGSIVACGLMWIAVIALLAMALAVLVKWRIAATGLLLAVFFVLPGFGAVADAILRTEWGRLFNLSYVFQVVWAHLFRMNLLERQMSELNAVPLWSAWASLLAVCAISLWLLNSKLKAREVERA